MAQIDITALDPVDAFTSTLRNLLEITEVFKKNENIPPLDMMRAFAHAKETLDGITFIVMTGMHMQVRDRIPNEVMEEFNAEQAAEALAHLDATTEQKIAKLKRLLAPFSMEFDMDEDDMPPGFGDG